MMKNKKKNKMTKRIIAVCCTILVLLSVMVVPISADSYNDYVNAWSIAPLIDGRSWFAENYGKFYGTTTFPDMLYSFTTKYSSFEVTDDIFFTYSDGTYYIGTGYFGFYSTSHSSLPRSSYHADGYVDIEDLTFSVDDDGSGMLNQYSGKRVILRYVSTTENRIVKYQCDWYYDDWNAEWVYMGSYLTHILDGANVMIPMSDADVSFFLAYHLSETVVSDVPVYSLTPFIEGFYGLTNGNWYDVTFLDEYSYGYTTGYENGYYTGEENGLGTGYINGYDAGYADAYLPAYNEGYTDGYDTGYEVATEEHANDYDDGYEDGKVIGYDQGRQNGYQQGLEAGFDAANTSQAWASLKNLIFAIFDAPFYVISYSLDFDLFGINIAGTLIALISLAIIVWILKIIVVKLF